MRLYTATALVVGSIFLAGCMAGTTPAPSTGTTPGIEEKQGDTTKTGVLVKQGEKYYIKLPSGMMEEVDTYAVTFSEYENSTVTVTGQYSGDTLFVGEIMLTVE